jgi:hypothetical protein
MRRSRGRASISVVDCRCLLPDLALQNATLGYDNDAFILNTPSNATSYADFLLQLSIIIRVCFCLSLFACLIAGASCRHSLPPTLQIVTFGHPDRYLSPRPRPPLVMLLPSVTTQ